MRLLKGIGPVTREVDGGMECSLCRYLSLNRAEGKVYVCEHPRYVQPQIIGPVPEAPEWCPEEPDQYKETA